MNQDSLTERHNATAGRHPVSKMCSKYAPMVTQLKTDMLHISKLLELKLIIFSRNLILSERLIW